MPEWWAIVKGCDVSPHYACRTDTNQKSIVKALRGVGAGVEITSGLGNGFVDLVVHFRGVTYLGECKWLKGKRSDAQIEFFARWRGGYIGIWRSPDEALRAIGVIE